MTQFLTFMLAPFLACLILVGIHVYLGIHILARGVIFVDLALAQIAALGAATAILFGYELESFHAYLFSLLFTFIGALVFSLTRMRHPKIPHEAIIGITYVVAAAAIILIMAKAPHGAEHVQSLLVGSILWVSWFVVAKTAVIYLMVGIIHWILRKKFLLISFNPEQAIEQGISIRWWDFLFYAIFGFVVTSSVSIAGVLLVFTFLIVPTVFAVLFTDNLSSRLVIGWIFGTLVSMIGSVLSYTLDLPTGAAIVCTFGVALLGGAGVKNFLNKKYLTENRLGLVKKGS
jgi:zinc/manganese transport system permease protein